VIFIAVSEVFVRLRWRMSLPCPHCSFDPLTYKTNRAEAVKKVQAHLLQLKQSGRYLMKSQNPFQNLAVVKVKSDDKKNRQSQSGVEKKSSQLLSRQV
jgi:hypothetical protein